MFFLLVYPASRFQLDLNLPTQVRVSSVSVPPFEVRDPPVPVPRPHLPVHVLTNNFSWVGSVESLNP